jgi:hypothetical protein
MKKILVLTTALVFALGAVAFAGDEVKKDAKASAKDTAQDVTLTGEVLDMYCYMQHPTTAVGTDHLKCAQSCISKGLPVGFLASDGTVYLVIGKDHEPANAMAAEWAGKQSTITGTVMDQKGIKAIELKTIGAAKS